MTLTLCSGGTEVSSPQGGRGFDARRLIAARRLRGWSRPDLATHAGLDNALIDQAEAGIQQVSDGAVRRCEKALGVRAGWCDFGRPTSTAGVESLFLRPHDDLTMTDRFQAVEVGRLVWELKTALNRTIVFPDLNLMQDYDAPDRWADPGNVARHLRNHWRLGRKPLRGLAKEVECHGVTVVDVPPAMAGNGNGDGAFALKDPAAPIIGVFPAAGPADVACRRFAIAQALGNLMLHSHTVDSFPARQHYDATRFATEFLAPRSALESMLPTRFNHTALQKISVFWGIPTGVLVEKAGEWGVVSSRTAKHWAERLQAEEKLVAHDARDWAAETPVVLTKAARLASDRCGVTTADLAAQLKISTTTVRSLIPHATGDSEHICGVPEEGLEGSDWDSDNCIWV